ncbi:PIG-L family deacetylase [Leucobacter sp. W1478]|uniref:PIG-L family deacetylase n=1 Tax=Leucobacter sp. W1478 TaxID=3439065 RepID=UPI003F2B8B4B
MVTFDAAEAGTPAREWSVDPRLHSRPALRIAAFDELVVIAAHPDDETLGAGGLIAMCHDLEVPVRVLCVTDGAASHPTEPGLAEARAAELASAIHQLAPGSTLEMLGFPDGKTDQYRDDIRTELAGRLRDVSPRSAIVAPWRGDGHRDHRVVGEVAAELVGDRTLLEYPIWMWHWATPDHDDLPWERMRALDIDVKTKSRAIESFASQITGTQPILRPDFLEHFARGQEFFMTGDHTPDREYFDALYEKSEDPWRFRTRWYEERKRRITIAVLPEERFERGLEVGCSIGVLTELLAPRCESLLALDISARAAEQARELGLSGAEIRVQDVVQEFPGGEFDLIVLSEVGYYWNAEDLRATTKKMFESLTPEGVLIACHWRHPVDDYPLSGDQVHAAIAELEWTRLAHHLEEDFVLEVFSTDPRSVAQREGLA